MADNYFSKMSEKDKREKQYVLNHQKKDETKIVHITMSISEEDKRKVTQHRVDTGESASAFFRRMISQELN